jgi:hypothetical protein
MGRDGEAQDSSMIDKAVIMMTLNGKVYTIGVDFSDDPLFVRKQSLYGLFEKAKKTLSEKTK